jgi:hypothetical protein
MQPPLDFEGRPRRIRKRRRKRRSYRLPRPFLVLLGFSAVFLLTLPSIRQYFHQASPLADTAKPFESGLTVAEAAFDNNEPRRIAGVIQNANPMPYGPVSISFSLWTLDDRRSGYALAKVDYLPANGRAAFISNDISKQTARFHLEEIAGQPAK